MTLVSIFGVPRPRCCRLLWLGLEQGFRRRAWTEWVRLLAHCTLPVVGDGTVLYCRARLELD
jgi:hypothetical protein